MSLTTPKFKSAEFKQALVSLKEIFDAHSLGIVLLDVLERKAAEQIVQKNAAPGVLPRVADVPKQGLCGHITGWFFASDDVAYQTMKELDRACQKERHIVASIPEAEAPERVGSYRAIALKRERAKFVWALSRDDRAAVRRLAARIINEFFREVADIENARAITRNDSGSGARLEDVELAKRIQAQAERLSEATTEVSDLQTRVDRFEEERARLLAEMGGKEQEARQALSARDELDVELKRLRGNLAELESKQREAETAKAAEREARAIAEDLAQKVRRLEKLAGAAEGLHAAQQELEEAKKKNEDLLRQVARTSKPSSASARTWTRSDPACARSSKRPARSCTAPASTWSTSRPGVMRRWRRSSPPRSDAILLDQANLAAGASLSFRRKVNFAMLLDQLKAGRAASAVAFVVDNGGTAFDAFCATLKRSGWDLRIKKPKRFADGTSKADWDMGIAIEAIERADEHTRIVLVSGDGDFAPLVRHLRRRGKLVEVAAFADGLAGELMQAADKVTVLDAGVLE